MKKTLMVIALSLLGAFVLMQFVPYRISNPPVRSEPNWDSPGTRELAVAACFHCHSNEVKVPWYGKVAPGAWLLARDVNNGRDALNFSEWEIGKHGGRRHDAADAVTDGSMPPRYFTWFGLHREAKLTKAERSELARGLEASLGSD